MGRHVHYRLAADSTAPIAQAMVAALTAERQKGEDEIPAIFRLLTAFTHPRRIVLYQRLHEQPSSIGELRARSGISRVAVSRHGSKLAARGFVTGEPARLTATVPPAALGRTLARLALE